MKSLRQGVHLGKRAWYQDQGVLAQGGMSLIHTFHDQHLLRTMVMKCPKEKSSRARHRLLFIKEALITGQLDHPNIPPIYDLWVDDNQDVCFTMKRVQGKTFTQLVYETLTSQGRSRSALEPLITVLMKVCDALSFAHDNGSLLQFPKKFP